MIRSVLNAGGSGNCRTMEEVLAYLSISISAVGANRYQLPTGSSLSPLHYYGIPILSTSLRVFDNNDIPMVHFQSQMPP